MTDRALTVLFAGGGTGGHLYPALAIADEVRRKRSGTHIVFVGTPGKIEARVVPARGYQFETIRVGGLARTVSVELLLFPLRLLVAVMRCWFILRRLQPSVVVGTGGYVSGPPVLVAAWKGIPTLLHEQNSYPGLTTRVLARWATEVHLTFESSRRWIRSRGVVTVSGNPTRSEIGTVDRGDAARHFGFDPAAPTVLVVGGSQGATSLNAAMAETAPLLAREGTQILWATGAQEYQKLERSVAVSLEGAPAKVVLMPYIEAMEHAYAVCDLAVTRAGASTVAELARSGVPAVLVPYPHAAADHQTENARAMVHAGAAVLVADADLPARLTDTVRNLLADRPRLRLMADRSRMLGTPRAAEDLGEAVLRLAESFHDES